MQSVKFLKFSISRIIKIGAKYYIDSIESDHYVTYNQKKYFLISKVKLINLGLRIPAKHAMSKANFS
jgi:hypothetical protein